MTSSRFSAWLGVWIAIGLMAGALVAALFAISSATHPAGFVAAPGALGRYARFGFGGGLVGGIVVGLARPFAHTRFAFCVVGVLGMAPVYGSLAWVWAGGDVDWFVVLVGVAMPSLITGAVTGNRIWNDDRRSFAESIGLLDADD